MSGKRQTRLLSEVSSTSAAIATEGRVIRPALALPTAILDECRLTISDEGLSILAMDPANVAMLDVQYYPAAFETFVFDGVEPLEVGLNLDALTSALSQARYGQRTSDAVALDIDAARALVEVKREYRETSVTYADEILCLDPGVVREEPNSLDLELPCEATIPVDATADAVGFLTGAGDHMRVTADDGDLLLGTDKESESSEDLALDGDGSDAGSEVTAEAAVNMTGAIERAEADVAARYSLDYVADIVGAIKSALATELALVWGDEKPACWRVARREDGETLYDGEFVLAPRRTGGDA